MPWVPLLILLLWAATASGADRIAVLDSLARLPLSELNEKGEKAFAAGSLDEALEIFSVLCRRDLTFAADDEKKIVASAFDRRGNILYRRGAYSDAMEAYLKSRGVAESAGYNVLLARVYSNIGNIYASSGDYPSALQFYRRSLEAGGEPKLRSRVMNNMFVIFSEEGELDSARIYHARYIREGYRDWHYDFDILFGRGMLHYKEGSRDSALACFRAAVAEVGRSGGAPLSAGGVCSYMSKVFENAGMHDSAVAYSRAAWRIAGSAGNSRLEVEALRDMSRQYGKWGHKDSALEYKMRFLTLADSISYGEEVDRLRRSQMLYELDESAETIENLNTDKRRQWQMLLWLGAGVLILLGMAAVLWRQNARLRKAWRGLYEKNERRLADERDFKARIDSLEAQLAATEDKVGECMKDEAALCTCTGTDEDAGTGAEGSQPAQRRNLLDRRQHDALARDIMGVMQDSEEICSPDFSIATLAAAIGSNPRYVSEVINEVFHMNFRAMLNEYRVKKAMVRLSDMERYGQYTIKAIAESVGYKSQATFISVFTRYTGLKPSMYQKLAKEKDRSADTFLADPE